MKFGHFDDSKREYVITTPKTPYPWINYLGTQGFFSLISNTAGGYSFYKDAKLRRITRYRYNNVPLDLGGGRIICLYEIPGHTPGSIALLDEKNHRLYTGDMFCSNGVMLQLPESTDVKTYLQSIRHARAICHQHGVKEIYPSHPECPLPVSVLDDFEQASLRYLQGRRSENEIRNNTSSCNGVLLNVK